MIRPWAGRQEIQVADQPNALAENSFVVESVIVIAADDNTSTVYFGGEGVDNKSSFEAGLPLSPNKMVTLKNVDLADCYISGTTAGDAVLIFAEIKTSG